MGVALIRKGFAACGATLLCTAGAAAQPGQIQFWQTTSPQILNVPAGSYLSADIGGDFCIGIRSDHTLAGWGESNAVGQLNVPSGTFLQVSCGTSHGAAIRTDGSLAAWGWNVNGETNVPAGTFTKLDSGPHHNLAIRTDGTLTEWGANWGGSTPTGQFLDVAAGDDFSVGLRTDGTVVAWGRDEFGQLSAPAGQFVDIAAGFNYGAALRADGTIAFWGADFGTPSLMTGNIRSISGEWYTLVGLRDDGTLTASSAISLPSGPFTTIATGHSEGLAITPAPPTAVLMLAGLCLSHRRRNR